MERFETITTVKGSQKDCFFTSMGTYASEPRRRVWDFCFSLSDLSELKWAFFRVGLATFIYGRAKGSETTKTPSMHAHSFRILSWNSAFSSIILFHIFVQAFDTLKITEHCFGTRDTLKKVICLSISQALFSCYAIFTWIWNTKLYRWQFSIGNHFHVK